MHKNNSSVMKRWIAGLSATFVMALSGLVPQPSHSQPKKTLSLSDVTFGCYKVNGELATVAVPRDQKLGIPIINWSDRSFSGFNYSARQVEIKCQEVSNRIEKLRQLDLLKYITIGFRDRNRMVFGIQPENKIICAIEHSYDDCTKASNFLLELPYGFDDKDFLRTFRRNSIIQSFQIPKPEQTSVQEPIINVTEVIGYSTPRFEIDRIITFTCSTSGEIPTTIARTSKGDIPVIIWKSNSFISSGWTREKRCREVSDKIDELRFNNSLNYITSGVIDEQSVICAVKTQTDLCTPESILFTLDKNSDPQKILKQIFLANADIPIDANGVGKLKDGRDFVCMSRSASGNCSGLLISAIEL